MFGNRRTKKRNSHRSRRHFRGPTLEQLKQIDEFNRNPPRPSINEHMNDADIINHLKFLTTEYKKLSAQMRGRHGLYRVDIDDGTLTVTLPNNVRVQSIEQVEAYMALLDL